MSTLLREASFGEASLKVTLTRLPGRAHTQIRVPIVARIVVDVETLRIEVANVDELAVGRLDAQPMCFVSSIVTEDCHKQTLP
jgi:hypothetical protein